MEFSDIALAKFLQTAPQLGPLIVNFAEVTEQVDDAQSGTRVGVFTLRAGAGMASVPVVSKGDTVFPIDSIYVDFEGMFRPLSNATISYITNMAAMSPGKAKKIPADVETNPSIYNLVNPPRTGKFVYASSSRLTEFLSALPKPVKSFVFEKIAAEQSLYSSLDKMFGLKAVFDALNADGASSVNAAASGPEPIRISQISVVTTPGEIKALANQELSKAFINQGYVVTGEPGAFRTAVAYQPYNEIGTFHIVDPAVDGGKDHMVVMKDGSSKLGYSLKYHRLAPQSNSNERITVFEDGTYARGTLISSGDARPNLEALETLFSLRPPKLLRELERDEQFVVFLNSGEALGPFTARSVTLTANGVEVKTGSVKLCGYKNFTKEIDILGDTTYLPSNVLVLSLGPDVSNQVEISPQVAANRKELVTAQFLGAQLDLRHDGIEYSVGNEPLGKFASAMKYLVEQENIDPDSAKNFLKQAQEIKYLKIFLSKKASSTDFAPAEIPQYGAVAPRQEDIGLNGSFLPALQQSSALGDPQAIESTIISQLLQVPDLFEYIGEYLPELEGTVDKLGRILFLSRVKLDQVSNALDSDSVFSLISQIKTVYKQLGDTSLKLKGIASTSAGFAGEEELGAPTTS